LSVDTLTPELKSMWEKEYRKSGHIYEKMVDEVLYTLVHALDREGIKYHNVLCRPTKIKTLESLCDKVNRKRIKDVDFSAVEDIAGVRVICLYRSDLQKVAEVISKNFEVVKEDTSRTRTVQPFGYSSDHYIVRFPNTYKGLRYDDLKGLLCEIQVRTILMDAWASVSHHLDYKQELDIPFESRANFNALAGLFYVADTNFELFKKGVEEARQNLLKDAQTGLLDYEKPINLDTLIAYLKHTFPKHEHSGRGSDYAELLEELRINGYSTLGKVDAAIRPTLPFLDEFEKELLGTESKQKPPYFADIGMLRCALGIVSEHHQFLPRRSRKEDEENIFDVLTEKYRKKLKTP
jgi:putative GTP pyrophosphokinase